MAVIALTLGLALAVTLVEATLRIADPIGRYYERETLHYFTSAIAYDMPPPVPQDVPEAQRTRAIAAMRTIPASTTSCSCTSRTWTCRSAAST